MADQKRTDNPGMNPSEDTEFDPNLDDQEDGEQTENDRMRQANPGQREQDENDMDPSRQNDPDRQQPGRDRSDRNSDNTGNM
ncbi:MAG: hypothetical protein H7Z40_23505 [Phycisphaerae bacterium]|nr:hypothetical protein [Gemmatimonadaceae bacterium]